MQETWVQSLGQKDPLEKGWQPNFSILAWSLVGQTPWGRKESDRTERLTHKHISMRRIALWNLQQKVGFLKIKCFFLLAWEIEPWGYKLNEKDIGMEKNVVELRFTWSSHPKPSWLWSERPLCSLTSVCICKKIDRYYSGSLLLPVQLTLAVNFTLKYMTWKWKSPLLSARVHSTV